MRSSECDSLLVHHMKNFQPLRRKIGSKPDHFKGTKFEWKKLVMSILTSPDSSKTWIKNKQGEWIRE